MFRDLLGFRVSGPRNLFFRAKQQTLTRGLVGRGGPKPNRDVFSQVMSPFILAGRPEEQQVMGECLLVVQARIGDDEEFRVGRGSDKGFMV